MTGEELQAWIEGLSDDELMERAGDWMCEAISAFYEHSEDPPPEGLGKKLCVELTARGRFGQRGGRT